MINLNIYKENLADIGNSEKLFESFLCLKTWKAKAILNELCAKIWKLLLLF